MVSNPKTECATKMKFSGLCLALFGTLLSGFASADTLMTNYPLVVSDELGICYAKSVPASEYGSSGTTTVFVVGKEKDVVLTTYDWYAQNLALKCKASPGGPELVSVVHMGPIPLGEQANNKDLALAFYSKEKLIKKYSTLDLAGSPSNVMKTAEHYFVVMRPVGYRWIGNKYAVKLELWDGRMLYIDAMTGEIVEDPTESHRSLPVLGIPTSPTPTPSPE